MRSNCDTTSYLMSATTVFVLIRSNVMTNMSAPYPRTSRINAVFIRYYLSPSIRVSLHAVYAGAYRRNVPLFAPYRLVFQLRNVPFSTTRSRRTGERRDGGGEGEREDNMPLYLYV